MASNYEFGQEGAETTSPRNHLVPVLVPAPLPLEVSLSSSLPPTGGCCPPQRNTYRNTTENFPPHPPAHIIDSSTTVACNMSDTYSEVERKIQQAVDEMRALKSTPVITDFARKYDVPYYRLHARFNGILAKSDLIPGNRRFSDIEEKALCQYLDRLDKLGLPVQRDLLRGAADYILLANWTPTSTDEKQPSVGRHWVSRFLQRHPKYTLKRQKVLDLERKRAESYKNLENWFQMLQDVITRFGINSDDIWNFDERGFRIGVGRDQLVITKQQRPLYLGHPMNRESATAIEAISAGGAHIPLFLIFSGITHQSSWYSNAELDSDTTIAVSQSGYSNDRRWAPYGTPK
jgi:hypothetical protein